MEVKLANEEWLSDLGACLVPGRSLAIAAHGGLPLGSHVPRGSHLPWPEVAPAFEGVKIRGHEALSFSPLPSRAEPATQICPALSGPWAFACAAPCAWDPLSPFPVGCTCRFFRPRLTSYTLTVLGAEAVVGRQTQALAAWNLPCGD